MNGNTARVLKGFLNLNAVEQQDFLKELDAYRNLYYDFDKRRYQEQVKEKASVGPKNTICDCCGR